MGAGFEVKISRLQLPTVVPQVTFIIAELTQDVQRKYWQVNEEAKTESIELLEPAAEYPS